jgi:hypothetical protein
MSGDFLVAAVLLLVGVVVLVAAWAIHWLMILVGLALILLGVYVAVGASTAGI